MDVINQISKDQAFPDAPIIEPSKYQPGEQFYTNGPRFHEFMHEIYENVLSKYETMTVGEMPYITDMSEIMKTIGSTANELNMIFNFDHMELEDVKTKGDSKWSLRTWELTELKEIISGWQKKMIDLDGWNALFLECHDQARSVSRYTDDSDEFYERGAKLLALMQTTLGGTLFVYQGEEIGMRNLSNVDPEVDYKDIESVNFWRKMKALYPEGSEELKQAQLILQKKARDNARTPMQWSDEPNAGFTVPDVEPWMKVNDDYRKINVNAQVDFKGSNGELSVWQYWQLLLRQRKTHKEVFVYGGFEDVDFENKEVYAYIRTGNGGDKWLIVMNWTGREIEWKIPSGIEVNQLVASSLQTPLSGKCGSTIKLQAWEGVLGRCTS